VGQEINRSHVVLLLQQQIEKLPGSLAVAQQWPGRLLELEMLTNLRSCLRCYLAELV
jgi:hypothetical protein